MRGFVTIATGAEKYYRLAENLLQSYRYHASDDTPFAIICDRETKETKNFDKVILMESANCSYMDKLLLHRYTPYEETIFIDADSLFLSDPKGLWGDFTDADDVSCYGCTYPLDSDKGWFCYGGCGVYKDRVDYVVSLHGGGYYIRKTELSKSIFEKAIELSENYHDYSFNGFGEPADEPVLALSMAIHKCKPCDKSTRILFVPSYRGKLSVRPDGKLLVSGVEKDIEIIHFATANTELFLYQYLISVPRETKNRLLHYMRVRLLTAPRNIRAAVRHMVGAVLRKFFDKATVDRWKKMIRK